METLRYLTKLRLQVFERSGGYCELQSSPKCQHWASWEFGHLAHVLPRGHGVEWTPENCKWGCVACHIGWEPQQREAVSNRHPFCPVCKAPIGPDCQNLQGRRIPPHRVRPQAALQSACAILLPLRRVSSRATSEAF